MKVSILAMSFFPTLEVVHLREPFSYFADGNQSDVVVLRIRTGKITHVIDDLLYNRLGAVGRAGADGLHGAFDAKFVSVGIERFRYSIGIEDQAIIALEPDGKIARYPIEDVSAVNSNDHAGRFHRRNALRRPFVKQRRIVSGARKRDAVVHVIKNEIGHADEHVLFDVGIKLAVHLFQNIRRRWILRCLTAQNAAANRHDKRRRHALAGNIGNRHAEPFLVHFDVIEIIAAHLARGHIDAADLEAVHRRRFCRQQYALNVARDLEVVIESLLFVRLRIDNRVIEREGRLFGNRFEDDKVALDSSIRIVPPCVCSRLFEFQS